MEDVRYNALTKMSKGAADAIKSGFVQCRTKDLERVVRLSDSGIKRLNRILEGGECLHLRHAIDRASRSTPQQLLVGNRDERRTAERIARVLNRICSLDFEERFREYSALHGWTGTIDEQEVIDCWNEMVRAWEAFRQTSEELAGK